MTNSSNKFFPIEKSGVSCRLHHLDCVAIHYLYMCIFRAKQQDKVRVNHCLANLAITEQRTVVWLGSGPEVVLGGSN
jgi:hypothetical protein